MSFRRLFDADTWTYSYLLADEASGEAVLIDPVREQANVTPRSSRIAAFG